MTLKKYFLATVGCISALATATSPLAQTFDVSGSPSGQTYRPQQAPAISPMVRAQLPQTVLVDGADVHGRPMAHQFNPMGDRMRTHPLNIDQFMEAFPNATLEDYQRIGQSNRGLCQTVYRRSQNTVALITRGAAFVGRLNEFRPRIERLRAVREGGSWWRRILAGVGIVGIGAAAAATGGTAGLAWGAAGAAGIVGGEANATGHDRAMDVSREQSLITHDITTWNVEATINNLEITLDYLVVVDGWCGVMDRYQAAYGSQMANFAPGPQPVGLPQPGYRQTQPRW